MADEDGGFYGFFGRHGGDVIKVAMVRAKRRMRSKALGDMFSIVIRSLSLARPCASDLAY